MPIRMTDTAEWEEDWFISISGEYQHLWKFIKDHCDVSGVWKPNISKFQALTKFSVSLDSFLKKMNGEKQRITVLDNGRWFIPGFIRFQYFNKQETFNLILNNPLHKSIYQSLDSNGVPLHAVRGLLAVYQGAMDKDKVINSKKVINKKVSDISYCFNDEKFVKKYNEWVDFRKEKRKKLSERAIKSQMTFLSDYNVDQACEIIEASIRNDWQGLFPPKNVNNGTGRKQTTAGSIQAIDTATADIIRDLDEAARIQRAD